MLGKRVDIATSEQFDEDKFTYWLQYETKAQGLCPEISLTHSAANPQD